MSDLISREAALGAIMSYCNGCDNYNGVRCGSCLIDNAIIAVDAVPSVDAVPVVRCRDCVVHGNCQAEEVFEFCGKHDGFCCVGKKLSNEVE